jgi:hypothetical protein
LHGEQRQEKNNADGSLSPFSTGRVQEINGPANGPFCFLATLFIGILLSRQPQQDGPPANGAAAPFRNP